MAPRSATIGWGQFSGLDVHGFLPISRNIGLAAMTLWVVGALRMMRTRRGSVR